MIEVSIRRLTGKDWVVWKELRLEALYNHPEAFGSSFEEESSWPDDEFQTSLKNNAIFGLFSDGDLIGSAGFFQLNRLKTMHRGGLWAMYIKPHYRGHGFADQLVKAIIDHARSVVTQLHLSVTTINPTALKLYQRHGFQIYGTEPKSLKVAEHFYDEYLMVLEL